MLCGAANESTDSGASQNSERTPPVETKPELAASAAANVRRGTHSIIMAMFIGYILAMAVVLFLYKTGYVFRIYKFIDKFLGFV